MKRLVDEFCWHCGPHACDHDLSEEESQRTWRYSVIGRDFAVSLCLSKTGGEFVVHLAPESAMSSSRRYEACDLLEGGCDVPHPESSPPPQLGQPDVALAPPRLTPGLLFWSEHGVGGKLEQPERFWRAFERRAREMVEDARRGRYRTTCCPRCQGKGTIEIKPKKRKAG